MRAMVLPAYGGPEVFELQTVSEPACGPGQVRVAVEFAGVNFTDVRNRRGDGLGRPPMVVGIEVSGRVLETGSGVEGIFVGDPGRPCAAVAGTPSRWSPTRCVSCRFRPLVSETQLLLAQRALCRRR